MLSVLIIASGTLGIAIPTLNATSGSDTSMGSMDSTASLATTVASSLNFSFDSLDHVPNTSSLAAVDPLWGKVLNEEEHADLISGTPAYHPWVVAVRWKGYHDCTGTLINHETIITSSTCVSRPSRDLSIIAYPDSRLGSENELLFIITSKTKVDLAVSSIAIVKVQLISGNPALIPAGLIQLDNGSSSFIGRTVSTITWKTMFTNPMSIVMQESKLEVIPTETCRQYAPGFKNNPFICAVQLQGSTRILNRYPADIGDALHNLHDGTPLFLTRPDGKVILIGVSTSHSSDTVNYAGFYLPVSRVYSLINQYL